MTIQINHKILTYQPWMIQSMKVDVNFGPKLVAIHFREKNKSGLDEGQVNVIIAIMVERNSIPGA